MGTGEPTGTDSTRDGMGCSCFGGLRFARRHALAFLARRRFHSGRNVGGRRVGWGNDLRGWRCRRLLRSNLLIIGFRDGDVGVSTRSRICVQQVFYQNPPADRMIATVSPSVVGENFFIVVS